MREADFFSVWRMHPLTILTGVLAMVYGLGFAFGWYDEGPWVMIGAALVGLCFVASLVAAWARARAA